MARPLRPDLSRYDLSRYNLSRYNLARYNLARYNLARYGVSRSDLLVFAALGAVMLITRTHLISAGAHVIDSSWASYFIAGRCIRSRHGFAGLFLLGLAIDAVMIRGFGTSDYCFTLAYWAMVPAYGALWLAGGWSRGVALSPRQAPALLAVSCAASFVAELISSGSFYAMSGRFSHPTLGGFLPRLIAYFPADLAATLVWSALAGAVALAISGLSGQRAAA